MADGGVNGPGSGAGGTTPGGEEQAAVSPLPPFDHDGSPLGETEPPGFFADLFQTRYREVTVTALVFAVIIGVVMNAAITYAGLKIGFTLTGSAIAAVLGFGILRGVMRRGTILETNIAQTVASGVNTSNSGVIFTVPVLLLMGYQLTFDSADFWLFTLACIGGGIMGAAFIVPLRKQMLDIERLRFPSAVGVSMILRSPGAGAAKAVVLLAGMALGALIYWPAGAPDLPASPASLDQLDSLVEREKIDDATRTRTLALAAWIDAEDAPPSVDAAAAAVAARDAAETAETERMAEAKTAGTPLERDARAARRAEIEGLRTAATDAIAATADAAPGLSEDLLRTVSAIEAGEAEWDDLRAPLLGWAPVRMAGYEDLELRLPRTEKSEAEAADLGEEDGSALAVYVDRDRNGTPDRYVTNTAVDVGRLIGLPGQLELVFAIAPFALGAGYITGRAGLFVLAGGILAFFVINPIAWGMNWVPATVAAHEAPGYLFGAVNRPLGIGLLLGGALMGVLASLPAIKEAVRSIGAAGAIRGGSDELSMKPLVVMVILGLIFLFVATLVVGGAPINPKEPYTVAGVTQAAQTATLPEEGAFDAEFTDGPIVKHAGYAFQLADIEAETAWNALDETGRDNFLEAIDVRPGLLGGMPAVVRAAIIAAVGAIWIWFAGIIIAQCTGMTDWSPISGMALLTVVLVLLLAGSGAVVGAVLIGATLCVAITLAADMMSDLKTGYLVGAKPKRQQAVEIGVVAIGPVVCMLTLTLIAAVNLKQTGIAMGPGTPTTAPQAQALQAVITGVQGGEMPYALYGFGAALGVLLGLGAFSGLGVLIGLSMYLPFIYIATYGIGCLANIGVAKVKGRAWAEEWGVPFAAGLVVGESLLQLGINIVVLLAG